MRDAIIRVRELSKQFRIGHAGRGDFLDRFMDRLVGRRAMRETFWALKNVSFDVPQGDSFGLVGPNGSGKSTLLKILARIYKPSSGSVKISGRVIPFLELGWGLLEREQTGWDNVYYAGVIFGLSRRDVDAVVDEIVRFAELEQYLHTPVKYYSTGMQIRLAFAIALFSSPDIFLVDEILAVGDIAFRQKCYDALKGLERHEETLVFVSHDLPAMREFCDHGLFLLDGQVRAIGDVEDVVEEYMFGTWTRPHSAVGDHPTPKEVDILNLRVLDSRGRDRSTFQPWEPVDICIDFRVNEDIDSLILYLQAMGENGEYYFGTKTKLESPLTSPTRHRTRAILSIPHVPLLQGKVLFTVSAMNSSMTRVYDRREKANFLWVVNTTGFEGNVDFHPDWRFEL